MNTDSTSAPELDLYKKYRPRNWDEIVGQDRVVEPLKKAIVAGRVPACLGFFGPAGCGKTTVARILAKALNCAGRDADDPNPCNECSFCTAIDAGEQMGFNYISMAGGAGSADNVRDIMRKAWLNQPLKRQVWILDEIHRIHAAAFDALLIPLEDDTLPSSFIMCSTAVGRVPKTVLSRISSRQFKSVDAETLTKLLEEISEKEGLDPSTDDINAAIMSGGGSVRDTIMSFETIIATGGAGLSHTADIIEAISEKDVPAALEGVSNAIAEGWTGQEVVEDVVTGLRNLLLAVSGMDRSVYGILVVSEPKKVAIGLRGKQGVIFTIDELGNALSGISRGLDPRLSLDLSIIKIITKLSKSTGGK